MVADGRVMPEPGVLSQLNDGSVWAFDMVMKGWLNTHERDVNSWTNLPKKAD